MHFFFRKYDNDNMIMIIFLKVALNNTNFQDQEFLVEKLGTRPITLRQRERHRGIGRGIDRCSYGQNKWVRLGVTNLQLKILLTSKSKIERRFANELTGRNQGQYTLQSTSLIRTKMRPINVRIKEFS